MRRSFERPRLRLPEGPSESAVKERFDRVIKGKLDYVQDGNWDAHIPELSQIKSIAIRKLLRDGKTERLGVSPIYSYRNYNDKETTGFTSLKLDQNGSLDASQVDWDLLEKRLQKDQKRVRLELLNAVLGIVEEYKPQFWMQADNNAVPLKPDPFGDMEANKQEESQSGEKVIDSRRLAYWPNCPDALFGVPVRDDVWAVCFKDFVVYDSPVYPTALAAHFHDEWTTDDNISELPAEFRVADVDREAYKKQHLMYVPVTKERMTQMSAAGTLVRKYHPMLSLSQEDYNKKMDEITAAFRTYADRRAASQTDRLAA